MSQQSQLWYIHNDIQKLNGTEIIHMPQTWRTQLHQTQNGANCMLLKLGRLGYQECHSQFKTCFVLVHHMYNLTYMRNKKTTSQSVHVSLLVYMLSLEGNLTSCDTHIHICPEWVHVASGGKLDKLLCHIYLHLSCVGTSHYGLPCCCDSPPRGVIPDMVCHIWCSCLCDISVCYLAVLYLTDSPMLTDEQQSLSVPEGTVVRPRYPPVWLAYSNTITILVT